MEVKGFIKKAINWGLYIGAILLVCFLFTNFVAVRTSVDGESMQPTLMNHDQLITEKVSYRFENPKRYDIVIVHVEGKNEPYIKRVIAVPGETVQIKEGKVYVNNTVQEEGLNLEAIKESREGLAVNPITLKDDEYFVMGDNRNNSSDSREIGPVKREDILGRAFVRIWPLSELGTLTKK